MAGALATSVASNLVSKLGEYLFAPIGRQFGYVLCYKTCVQDLENGVEKLETARERVQHSVQEAKNNGKCIEEGVKKWLESVENEATQARNLLKHGESAKNACFCRWLPNPMVRHPIGRKVKKMTQLIQELHDESTKYTSENVFYEGTPIGFVTAPDSFARSIHKKENVLESRASITEDVKKAIADNKVCVVGVYGPGGVGKTKLLEDVESRVREEKLFDVVAKANVSRNPNLKEIQGEIAYALGLNLTNDEPPSGRADRLSKILENYKGKILIILDDLWKKLELKKAGIPCGEDNKVRGCKLLLTSRYRDVLRNDMVFDREFRLNELKHEEARRLFERTVGDRVNDPDFKCLVDRVVKNCGGLPLLILSVAKRLRHGDLAEWSYASTNIELSDAKSIVELNYNDLKDERIKSLFLVSALNWGDISMRWTLVYCMGLGLYKKFKTIKEARNRLIIDLHRLQDYSLLLDSDDMEVFKMHDIFVDVAISIASPQWSTLVGRENYGFKEWSKDELIKCTALSFTYVGIDELPKRLDCPNLRILVLGETNSSLKIPESFLESTKKLQVLDFTRLSFTSLPSSIEYLEDLKSLCLDDCHLEDVTILGKLKGLQFLSFYGSAITRLPKEIGELIELRFLNLTGCTKLKIIEPGVLGRLVNLEELYMECSFDQWEVEDEVLQSNASLAELKNMKKLRTLYVAIPHPTNLSSDLPFGNLNEYRIQIGIVTYWWGEYKESRTLKLKLDSSSLLDEVYMQECLGRTQDLHLDGLQDGRDSIHGLCNEGFQELEHLYVKNNSSFQYVVDSTLRPTFTRLESLVLQNLNNLEKICRDCLAPESFNRLKTVKVDNCGEIKHLFPLSMRRIFLQLEEIEITKCHLIQQIVAPAEADEYRDEIDDDADVKSCKLHRLTLKNLPEMTSFYKPKDHSVVLLDGQQVSLPWMESLTLSKLPKLKEIWNSRFPSDVSNLKFLKVEDCAFLTSIFPSNLVMKLQNLETIVIERCQFIRKIFDLEVLTARGDVEILSQLTTLTLSDLPRLEHIWNKDPRVALCFRNLKVLKVQGCENFRFIFSSSMAKALQQIKEIKIARCKLLEKIIEVQEEESKRAASMDTLEFPLLSSLSLEELPNLKTFSPGTHRIHCPTLTRLRISGCPKMMTFSSFQGKQQTMTANTSLQQALGGVNSSLSLPILFDHNEVVAMEESEEQKLKEVKFSRFHTLKLCSLKSLISFSSGSCAFEFPSLTNLSIMECTELKAFILRLPASRVETTNEGTASSDENPHSLFDEKVLFPSLEELKLSSMRQLKRIWHNQLHGQSFCKLASLTVELCENLSHTFPSNSMDRLQSLSKIEVVGCPSLEALFEPVSLSSEKRQKLLELSALKKMKLLNLPRLTDIMKSDCEVTLTFPSLMEVNVRRCHSLSYLFSSAMAKTLYELVVLDVSCCNNLRGIIAMEEGKGKTTETFEFRQLTKLKLGDLKSLICFSSENCVGDGLYPLFDEKLAFPKLEELHIEGVQQEELWNNKILVESFCYLKVFKVKQCHNLVNVIPSFMSERLLHYIRSLTVEECPRLRNLFTISMAKSLGQLQYLGLGGCKEMEYIVAKEEEKLEEATDKIVIPQLVTLYLHNMPKLISFYQGKHISEWPSLKKFTIEDCKAVKVILGDANCRKLEGSGPTQQPLLLVEKVEFPNMESMEISHMNNMEKIWLDGLASNAFRKLKTLIVEHCEKLSSIFSSYTMLTRFQTLEKITVTDCGSLEVVFHVQEFNFSEARTSIFQLRELVLMRLPKMKHVWSGHHQGGLTYGHIRHIEVVKCERLKSLFPSLVAKSMTQLGQLLVSSSGVEEIIAEEDGVDMSANDLFFLRLTDLRLLGLPNLRSFYRNSHTSKWPILKQLRVRHCGKRRSFSFASEIPSCHGSTTSDQRALFSFEKVIPNLEGLTLTREDVMTMMQQHYIFGNLRELELACYHDENVAFPSDFLLHRFPNLEVLSLSCSSLEEIFSEDVFGHGGATPYGELIDVETPLRALKNLKQLELNKLCKLQRVWKDGSLMVEILKQIESLLLSVCSSLSIVFPSPTTFQGLTELEVKGCTGLVHMGTCSAMLTLVHLAQLILRDCDNMEDVVTDDGNEVEEISFPKLYELILDGLPSLESFSSTNCAIRFPSLKWVIVKQCPKMNIFCNGALSTPKLYEVLLSNKYHEPCWEGDLNTTIQSLST
ncbi:hypothetical protein BT93_B0821 [Corymbia citriodora subsp. variegata]|nr:hypothetical protein BT93_B0821 [Corymbia citriodora subsp. variegata]